MVYITTICFRIKEFLNSLTCLSFLLHSGSGQQSINPEPSRSFNTEKVSGIGKCVGLLVTFPRFCDKIPGKNNKRNEGS